jgi:hypothetical protein
MTTDVTVTYRILRIWPALWWVRTCRLLRYIIGVDRASRWAIRGVGRLLNLTTVKVIKMEFKR